MPGGGPLINVEETNVGNATALDAISTAGLFIAPRGSIYEGHIFDYLYTREHDPTSIIPFGDLPSKRKETIPITGPARREDGTPANDTDRMDIYSKAKVYYVTALVAYQDSHGRTYHRELCYFVTDPRSLIVKCNSHNGQGVR
jgi:hypothetical protein